MPQRWYETLEREDGGDHPADAAIEARLAGDPEYAEVGARLHAENDAFASLLGPAQRATWREVEATMNHRFDLRAIAHFNAGVDHGLKIAIQDGGEPNAAVKALAAALVRAAGRL